MIRIFLGNVGSGKTACAVREMILNESLKTTYSNINTSFEFKDVLKRLPHIKGTVKAKLKDVYNIIPNNKVIKRDMIIKTEKVRTKKDGTDVEKISFNQGFWQDVNKKEGAINVIIDEAHTVFNARKSMSGMNKAMSDFMAMLRRILGSSASGYGELTLITQLKRRIDVIAREMATNVRFHRCHYLKVCPDCGFYWKETNDDPEPAFRCLKCNSPSIEKKNHVIEVWHFKSMEAYEGWEMYGMKTYHLHYYVNDIEKYFPYYDTLQWEDMIS